MTARGYDGVSVDVPQRPLLSGFYEAVPIGADKVLFRCAGRVVRLAGQGIVEHAVRLFDALNGTCTVREICERLSLEEADVAPLLQRLAAEGLVADAADGRWEPSANGDGKRAEVYRHLGVPPSSAAALGSSRVAVFGSGQVAIVAADQLKEAGLGEVAMVPDDPADSSTAVVDASLVIVEVENGGERARTINRACLDHRVPALFFVATAHQATVGPLVEPFSSACFECTRARRLAQLRFYDEEMAYEARVREGALVPRRPALLPGWAAVVAGLVSVDAQRRLGRFGRPTTLGGVLVAEIGTLEVHREEVLAVPDCPECGRREVDIEVGE